MEFRKYQLEIIKKGADVLGEHGFLYLAMEVRTGKTLTSLGIAGEMRVNSVLFVRNSYPGILQSDVSPGLYV